MAEIDPQLWYDFIRFVMFWPKITAFTIDRIHPDKIPRIHEDDEFIEYKVTRKIFSDN